MIDKIGKYRIDGTLGTGAMGVVYKAYDANIARVVALKTIRSELLDGLQQAELIARFKNEAQASGRLVHPNIVTVYDFGEIDTTTYIAMEYVDGTPLNAYLVANVPMDLAASITCLTQLLRALHYAHSRGVVHRDIKPANLLITADAQVKITDFGIAKIESSTLTQVGSVIGTPSYMSPEQFRGESVDGRSDIFSVGILLYQMLTGVRPFAGSASEVMHQIINETPVKPSVRQAGVHPAFDTVVLNAMAKKAEERYPNAQAFLDALLAAHLQHTGGTPITEEDNERTILAFQRPAQAAAPASRPSTQPTQTDSHGVSLSGSAPQWQVEVIPDLQVALSQQIGPMARVLIKNAARQAVDVDDLCAKLLPHITSELGRTQFMDTVRAIKKKLGISTLTSSISTRSDTGGTALGSGTALGAATQMLFGAAVLEKAEQKLVPFIGPIAKVMVKRAAKNSASVRDFHRMLAENLSTEQERLKFLKDVGEL